MVRTAELARFATELRSDDIPAEVRRYAAVLIADTLGAGLYGSTTEVGDLVLRSVRERSGGGDAPVWGRIPMLDAASAALVNGVQAHACELDDYHPGAKCHPGAVIVPAALAIAAGRRVSGHELLRAVTAGYEIMVRVSLAAGANATRRRGWHLTGLVGPFGAATAVALLEGCSTEQLLHALGIAGSHAAGLFAFSSSGAMTKRLHAGRAAEAGVVSVRLAVDGFTGPPDVLEATDGGLLRAVSDASDVERLTAGLGDGFELANVAVKPYSCCGSLHSSIDAVMGLATDHDLLAEDIESITAHNSSVVDQQCGFDYTGSGGLLEAQMSLQYCLAVAAIDRAAFLPQFTPERVARPDVQALARRVRFALDEQIDAAYPTTMPARVSVTLTDGRHLERSVPGPTGSTFAPHTFEDVRTKVRVVSRGVLPEERVERLLKLVDVLDDVDDLRELGEVLRA